VIYTKAHHTCASSETAVCSTKTDTRCISSKWRRKCQEIWGKKDFFQPSPSWMDSERNLHLQSQGMPHSCLQSFTFIHSFIHCFLKIMEKWSTYATVICLSFTQFSYDKLRLNYDKYHTKGYRLAGHYVFTLMLYHHNSRNSNNGTTALHTQNHKYHGHFIISTQ